MPKVAIETHQFFNAYRKAFGLVHTRKLFGVKSEQTVYKWCADPDYCAETRPNPLDRLETMLTNLMEAGETATAQGLVDRLAALVDCRLVCEEAIPDKATLEEELLDNLSVLAEHQEAVRDLDQPMAVVRTKARAVIREINEDLALAAKARSGR